jgi:hypothetical protein
MGTTTTAMPKKINPRWLEGRQSMLRITVKTENDGSPNPHYVAMAAEVAEAESELVRWQTFEGWAKTALGLILNLYPLRTKGLTYEPGQVFLKKDKATGQITFLTRQDAWQKYLEAH